MQQREQEARRREVEEEVEKEREQLREEMRRQLQAEREELERTAEELRRQQAEQRLRLQQIEAQAEQAEMAEKARAAQRAAEEEAENSRRRAAQMEQEEREGSSLREARERPQLLDHEEQQRTLGVRRREEEQNHQLGETHSKQPTQVEGDALSLDVVVSAVSQVPASGAVPDALQLHEAPPVLPSPAPQSSLVEGAARRRSLVVRQSLSVPRTSILLGSKSPLIRSRGSIITRNLPTQQLLPADGPFQLDTSDLPTLPAAAPPPLPVVAPTLPTPTPTPPPSNWITAADRDGLFDYLADEADLFTQDVALNDSALDALLTAGGSMTNTVVLCRLIDSKAKQFDSVQALRAEIEAEAKQQRVPHHTGAATVKAKGSEWMTDADRDALFDFLASDGCALFTADVKLNNRALNAMLAQGGSLDTALVVLRTLQERHRTFATVDDLVHGMVDALPPPTSPPSAQPSAPLAPPPATNEPAPPPLPATPPPSKSGLRTLRWRPSGRRPVGRRRFPSRAVVVLRPLRVRRCRCRRSG